MNRDTFPAVTERPSVDYAHLPGEEQNPLMESTAHVDWGLVLLNSARHSLAATDNLVTGNVAFAPGDGAPHTAPDLMVIPGAAGRDFGRYEPGPDDPLPSVCVEIVSPSNTRVGIRRRCLRLLQLGVPEVYVLDPKRESITRVELAQSVGEPCGAASSTDGGGFDIEIIETSAVGVPSSGLALTFAMAAGHLAVCCPAGRMVRPGDDPLGWLVEADLRADKAELRADVAEEQVNLAVARADQAEARIAELLAEIERLKGVDGH